MPKISPIPARKLMRVFERAGFSCVRIEGDHYVYTKDGVARPIVIPDWREIPVFIIKNNLRSANISREEYFSLLAEVN
ncbi:MAG: type II toxin-antitoxin system HicA family toxin [Acidobacteria bacterium]|nr:type II toxin-antitoxin system HicA family toxin [Acidobacteriota bacterium]MBU4307769.1 type II toxin-antitoxin system HicA family toxin [Acidobacteriota bacterium]MCG2810379.1 type II toxin-antitoxin system HicA family toxin [Candidatus Aminicenantes bacterium]